MTRSDRAGIKNAARSRWTRRAAFLFVALVGLAVRLPQLGARPMHTDEAVNAYIVGQLLSGDSFTYDPQDRHGPALAAVALPLAKLQGARSFAALTESELRLAPVLAGTITILLLGAAADMFGIIPCAIAALLFAFSPLTVYYDRYFIHESLFVAATLGLILSGWRAWERTAARPAVLAGASAALMLACKETAVLHFFALAAAGFIFRFWNIGNKGSGARLPSRAVLFAAITFALVTALLFTWFGHNWKALFALMQGVPQFLARAAGQGHQKPFWYYGQLLSGGWSGGVVVVLACIGFLQTIRKRDASAFGFLAYYAFLVAAIYSLIPYKTPWLALNLWLPISLFAARGMEWFWRAAESHLRVRIALPASCLLAALLAVLIAHDTRQRVFVHPADETNPYVYAHTSEDLLGLPAEIQDFAHRNGIMTPRIAVIATDPWPLPWYLRRFSEVGFWQPGQQPGDADFYITSADAAEQYANRLQNSRPDFFGLRPGVLILLWLPALK